jgi:hypothetical protein
MPDYSHSAKKSASPYLRRIPNDFARAVSHNATMARRGDARGRVDWFLKDWMDTLGVRQVDMQHLAGWSPATASQLYNGVQSYSPKIVKEAAAALNLSEYELLMRPHDAMALRKLKGAALHIAEATRDWQEPIALEDLTKKAGRKKLRT